MKNYSVAEGSTFRILCPVLPGNPTSQTLQWKSEGNYTMATTAVLSISNVSRENNMMYICILTYMMKPTGSDIEEVGEVSKTFYLRVLYRTIITKFTTNDLQTGTVVVSYYDTVQLTCVVDSNPDSNISILFNETILEQTAKSKRLTFNMKKADCSNAGVYTCIGGNEYNYGNMARANLTVFVKCKPRPSVVLRQIQTVKSALNMPAKLTFTAASYLDPGKTSFIWMRQRGLTLMPLDDDKNIIITTIGLQSSLTIISATHTDSGNYLLIYKNSVGSSNFTFKLMVTASLPRPGAYGDSSNTGAFVAVGVGTFVTTLIIVGIVFIVNRRLRRRSTLSTQSHAVETHPDKQTTNANTKDYHNINEYELIQVSKDVTDRKGNVVGCQTGTSTETDSSMQYESIDNSKKDRNQYCQLPATRESQTNVASETTDQIILDNDKSNSSSEYINMRIQM
ncbi:hemicentin-2-like [Mercenaria mercenaria]|uniref:hemicentin-2-like n=1 Tax=Mercenaria mercenaria TaxID=6596 RepID=UPI00234E6BA6|nr:hemicentin-2-like [Mercenaria mercenaria]